ncbi:galactosylgalactosylxylosylprotein 3-beta-glucuronosyltransferase 3-like [Anneissia japonica]|uniref:galactosylgalactosylxylosylprotein 3-beta-glucuronosyltransferase 3-like n=1 Tax=Anneissia japonica TaxID=1529436 RepID=UPI0014256B0B|nr:galactosylgalactosylxylosylprotein 3-beta-glucuronosyltransferase 3-like [Anneissia japonica]
MRMGRSTIQKLLILCLCASLLGFFMMIMNIGFNCQNGAKTKGNVDGLAKEINDDFKKKMKELEEKEKNINLAAKRLDFLQTTLRRQYPYAVDYISQIIDDDLPTIYAITPTYARHVQKAELTRISQTFLHIKNFHWIVVEDALEKSQLVSHFLEKSGLVYTHLNTKTPEHYQLGENDPSWLKPRGVEQRNLAIDWLLRHVDANKEPGVLYFADDDNTYDLQIFHEMRSTQTVSVWPVGIVGGLKFERPLLNAQGRVYAWYTAWKPERPFAIDMAGFAVNLQLLQQNSQARFDIRVPRGYIESSLLSKIVTMEDLEPKADLCTKVYVWHTRTEKPKMKQEDILLKQGKPSDPNVEV